MAEYIFGVASCCKKCDIGGSWLTQWNFDKISSKENIFWDHDVMKGTRKKLELLIVSKNANRFRLHYNFINGKFKNKFTFWSRSNRLAFSKVSFQTFLSFRKIISFQSSKQPRNLLQQNSLFCKSTKNIFLRSRDMWQELLYRDRPCGTELVKNL